MKQIHVIITAFLMLGLTASVVAQDAQKKMMDMKKQMHTKEMMKDAAMVDMVMDEIAGDDGLRMKMMEKMMTHAHKDSTAMMSMCKTMMDDKDMHSMMMKMMGGGMKGMKGMKGMMHEKMDEKKDSMDHKEHH